MAAFLATTMPTSTQITQLLREWTGGNEQAFAVLAPVLYKELHRLAKRQMASERPGHTLQATALVNEAYLRLMNYKGVRWQTRLHFYSACAQIMRHILVDHARSHGSKKRGGDFWLTQLDEAMVAMRENGIDLLQLNEALQALRKINRRQADVVDLRFFVGLSVDATATVLKVSPQTILRDWAFAKVWLLKYMKGQSQNDA
jgi:RNA polymerase sigma factor (TIGR02999 family)